MVEEKQTIGASSAVDVETATDLKKKKHVDPTLEKHAHDADEAMKALEELHGESLELDEPTNRRLLRIIDWHMMPIMCCIYGMNFLDSTSYEYNPNSRHPAAANQQRNYLVIREYHGNQDRPESSER
jgi:ACS family allantoate permease-like MFS transporter